MAFLRKDRVSLAASWLQGWVSGMFIPDPNFSHPGPRAKKIPASASKILSILTKNLFLSSRKYDTKYSFGSRILIFSHPGSRIQGSKKHRIPVPQHCLIMRFFRGSLPNHFLMCWIGIGFNADPEPDPACHIRIQGFYEQKIVNFTVENNSKICDKKTQIFIL